jgi:hypothetical protein
VAAAHATGAGNDDARRQALAELARAYWPPLYAYLRRDGQPPDRAEDLVQGFFARLIEKDDLRAVDAVLTRNGLSQPLVIGEERYNDAAAAAAVAEFVRTSARPVLEVMEWPLYEDGAAQPRCSTLPFRIDEYAEALRGGSAPKVLTGSVGKKGQLALRTPFGQPARALVEGTYAVTVLDASSKHSFRLSGRSLDRRSGVRFQGTRTWIVSLGAGFYTYASEGPRTTQKSFSVLTPG